MKTKEEKAQIIKELKSLFEQSPVIILVSLLKLKGENQKIFKDSLKSIGGTFKVFKKSLIKKAFDKLPIDLDAEEFKQPFGLIFSSENLQVFKKLSEFSEQFGINIIKGLFRNNILTKENILELGQIPSLDFLKSKLTVSLKYQLQHLCFVLKNPLIKLNMVVSNINKK